MTVSQQSLIMLIIGYRQNCDPDWDSLKVEACRRHVTMICHVEIDFSGHIPVCIKDDRWSHCRCCRCYRWRKGKRSKCGQGVLNSWGGVTGLLDKTSSPNHASCPFQISSKIFSGASRRFNPATWLAWGLNFPRKLAHTWENWVAKRSTRIVSLGLALGFRPSCM